MTSTELQQPAQTTQPALANPFQRQLSEHVNAGTVEIESSRAIAEAQGKLVIAQRFPRNQAQAFERIIEACKRPGLAKSAFYSYPRGGQTVSGPSIRLAEELARCWGNIDYGLRELSNRDGVSEMEAYAWDLQTNTVSSQRFTVRHIRDKREGGQNLTDQRDIYEITANMGARRLRARIMAILPDDVVESAVQQCKRTLAGDGSVPIADRVKAAIGKFAEIGVTVQHLEAYIGKPLSSALVDDVVDLQGIFTSIRDGITKASDWFGVDTGKPQIKDPSADQLSTPATKPAAAVNDNAAQSAAAKKNSQRAEKADKPVAVQKPAQPQADDQPAPALAEPAAEQQVEKPAPTTTAKPQAEVKTAAEQANAGDLF